MLLKSQQLKSTKFFIPDHDHTNPYFKNARVNSCSKILVKNGQSLAIPYKIVNSKGKRLNHFLHYRQNGKTDIKSSYQQDYSLNFPKTPIQKENYLLYFVKEMYLQTYQ